MFLLCHQTVMRGEDCMIILRKKTTNATSSYIIQIKLVGIVSPSEMGKASSGKLVGLSVLGSACKCLFYCKVSFIKQLENIKFKLCLNLLIYRDFSQWTKLHMCLNVHIQNSTKDRTQTEFSLSEQTPNSAEMSEQRIKVLGYLPHTLFHKTQAKKSLLGCGLLCGKLACFQFNRLI